MARRLIKHVKLAAAVALLLDGGEELLDRADAVHRGNGRRPRYVNDLALTRAAQQREEMLARTVDALRIAQAAAGTGAVKGKWSIDR
jgi:hypothetical protein